MEALRATAAEMAAHEAQRLAARQAAADATYRAALSSEVLAALAALAALIGLSFVLVAPPARPRRGRSADRRARRAPARHAREHRRRRDHDRPGRAHQQPQPRRRGAHRLACRGSARAAAGGGLSHRQRIDARAGREPGAPRASRRRDRRAGESHLADQAGRLGNADRRQRGADPRPAGPGARLHPRLSRHQREEGRRARDRRSAGAPAARRHRHGDPDDGLRRGWRGRSRQRRLDRDQRLRRRRAAHPPGMDEECLRRARRGDERRHRQAVRPRGERRQRRARDHDGERREADLALRHRADRPRRQGPAHARDQCDRRHRAAPPRAGARREGSAHAAGHGGRELRWLGVGSRQRPDDGDREDARTARLRRRRADRLRAVPAAASSRRPAAARARDRRGLGERRAARGVPRRPARRRAALDLLARPCPARRRRQRADARRRRRHHRAEARAGGARGRRPEEGRVPRHAGARAAQPARAAAQLARDPAAQRRRPGDLREGERRDGAPAQPPRSPDRRPARRQPASASTS